MKCLAWQILDILYSLLWIAILVAPFILVPLAVYDNMYPIDRDIVSRLDLATTLTNATEIRQELVKAYENLEPYHGNPKWLYPTPRTDFNHIRQKLGELINTTREVEKMNLTQYAYHQYIANLKQSIQEIKELIGEATLWKLFNPTTIILSITYIITLIILYIKDNDIDNYISNKLWECRYK